MDAGKIIGTTVMAIFIVYIIVVCLNLLIPIQLKAQLDTVCREAQVEAQLAEGVTDDIRIRCKSSLNKLGVENVNIAGPIPGQMMRGERQSFYVTGTVTITYPDGFLSFNHEKQTYTFDGSLLGRRIEN